MQIDELSQRLAEQGYSIQVKPAAKKVLIEKGWDPKYGGRPLRRALQKELEDPLSTLILEGDYPPGTIFAASVKHEKIYLKAEGVLENLAAAAAIEPIITQ